MMRTKMIGTKPFAALMAAVLCLLLCPAVAFAASLETTSFDNGTSNQTLQTMSGKDMKSRGVLFDLKKGKPVSYYLFAKGVGKIRHTATVTSLKITSKKPGYKTATITITHRLAKNLTVKQQKALFKAYNKYRFADNILGWKWNHFADFKTGLGVEAAGSDFDVTWEKLDQKLVPTKTYRDSKTGAWFYLNKQWTAKYSITYPDSYKGLCIGVGGETMAYNDRTAADRKWESKEKISYFKTSHYKKGLKNNHFMRIS